MLKEVTATGRTVDEAIDEGCKELGIDRADAKFEILTLPKKGFLGLKVIPAKVRVYQEMSKADLAVQYITSILREMGVSDFKTSVKVEDDTAYITLTGDNMGIIIGRRGETLDAIQHLASLAANRGGGDYLRITIDSGNYRENREKTLQALARRRALAAVKTGRSVTLEPMNPYERRIIHAAVAKVEGATSTSVGEEPNRRVVISSTVKKPAAPRGGKGPKDGDRRRGGNGNKGGKAGGGSRGGRDNNRSRKPRREEPQQELSPLPIVDAPSAEVPEPTVIFDENSTRIPVQPHSQEEAPRREEQPRRERPRREQPRREEPKVEESKKLEEEFLFQEDDSPLYSKIEL